MKCSIRSEKKEEVKVLLKTESSKSSKSSAQHKSSSQSRDIAKSIESLQRQMRKKNPQDKTYKTVIVVAGRNRKGKRDRRELRQYYIMPPALIGCGWLIVMGMLNVWRLLKVGPLVMAAEAEVIGFVVGGGPFAMVLSEAVT